MLATPGADQALDFFLKTDTMQLRGPDRMVVEGHVAFQMSDHVHYGRPNFKILVASVDRSAGPLLGAGWIAPMVVAESSLLGESCRDCGFCRQGAQYRIRSIDERKFT